MASSLGNVNVPARKMAARLTVNVNVTVTGFKRWSISE